MLINVVSSVCKYIAKQIHLSRARSVKTVTSINNFNLRVLFDKLSNTICWRQSEVKSYVRVYTKTNEKYES